MPEKMAEWISPSLRKKLGQKVYEWRIIDAAVSSLGVDLTPVGRKRYDMEIVAAGFPKDRPSIIEWRRKKGIPENGIGFVQNRPSIDVNSDAFLASYEWRRLRMEALKREGARCQCCGASPKDGVKMHVDHIKPRRIFPHLALEITNLQVLCEVCNHGKGNWDMTDWREKDQGLTADQVAHLQDICHA
jgi:hypothetical protein